jgi:hypothetical protein
MRTPGKSRFGRGWDYALVAGLAAIVTLTWCTHYNRWSRETWGIPINYVGGRALDMVFTGDAIWGMAAAKLTADGELGFFRKYPVSLGAPFRANWNDWPTFEEAVNAWWAILVRVCGLFTGSNLATVFAHVLAAVTFYLVCRLLGYHPLLSAAGGGLFGLSRYAFWRNLPNLSLTYYWHLPLGLLVCWWCIQEKPTTEERKKLFACAAVAVIFAVQNAYYTMIFLQLLFWAAVYCLLRWRDWRRTLLPLGTAAIMFVTLVVVNLDTILSYRVNGPNLGAAVRAYYDVERYALQPLELALPLSHSLAPFAQWANVTYFKRTLIMTEQGSAYLGVLAVFALGWLSWRVVVAVARRDLAGVPCHFWGLAFVFAFCTLGSLNGIAGVFGFRLFRSSNRFSIVILAIALLFLVRQLSWATRKWGVIPVSLLAALLLAFGIYDEVPPRDVVVESEGIKAWQDDEKFVRELQGKLSPNSMVFQMPVREFPEANLIGGIDDYEDMRPFVHSSELRFSYGDSKGRYNNRWQKEAEQLGPAAMLRLLERYGFGAVLINRHGYDRAGEEVVESFRALGKESVLAESESDQWICIGLNPARRRAIPPVFAEGWYGLEGDARENKRWSSGNATLVLHNPEPVPQDVSLAFALLSQRKRSVQILADAHPLYAAELGPDEEPRRVQLRFPLKPGKTEIYFKTDGPGESVRSAEKRTLAFAISDFELHN